MPACDTEGCEQDAVMQYSADCQGSADCTAIVAELERAAATAGREQAGALDQLHELEMTLIGRDEAPTDEERAQALDLAEKVRDAQDRCGRAEREAAARSAAHEHPVLACPAHDPGAPTGQEG